MLLACSHVVLASADVPRVTRFFAQAFDLQPVFENAEFSEFVLPSGFRIAFFLPTGKTTQRFDAGASRAGGSLGVTVRDVDAAYERLTGMMQAFAFSLSGAPKDHPWGERSFLLTDPDGNRWEVTRAPSESGMLVAREGV
jgi:catechol 2,3-dioxygenase-like lactoylglutathione lyase family enzyme